MNPVKHPWTNIDLGKPANWDSAKHGECEVLPVMRHDGCFYSYWRVGIKDRLRILFGRQIRLCLTANFHPPVMLDMERP